MTQRAECPECAARVPFPVDVVGGAIVQCGACAVNPGVARDGGIALRPAPEEEEDRGE